jgi:hypothetical protein
MSRTFHHGDRRIRVRGDHKDPPDLRRLARALIALAQAEAESEAEAEAKTRARSGHRNSKPETGATPAESGTPPTATGDAA